MHGDLAERFENEVLHNPNEEERGSMMAVMNILCGHIEMECAYTMYRKDQDECEDKCQHQFWNEGDDDYVYPCYFSDDHWEDDDHWDDDHWEDDDHSDGHLWEMIMRENRVCFVFESSYNSIFQILVPRSQMDSLQL